MDGHRDTIEADQSEDRIAIQVLVFAYKYAIRYDYSRKTLYWLPTQRGGSPITYYLSLSLSLSL
jgi:hypothetical protein